MYIYVCVYTYIYIYVCVYASFNYWYMCQLDGPCAQQNVLSTEAASQRPRTFERLYLIVATSRGACERCF